MSIFTALHQPIVPPSWTTDAPLPAWAADVAVIDPEGAARLARVVVASEQVSSQLGGTVAVASLAQFSQIQADLAALLSEKGAGAAKRFFRSLGRPAAEQDFGKRLDSVQRRVQDWSDVAEGRLETLQEALARRRALLGLLLPSITLLDAWASALPEFQRQLDTNLARPDATAEELRAGQDEARRLDRAGQAIAHLRARLESDLQNGHAVQEALAQSAHKERSSLTQMKFSITSSLEKLTTVSVVARGQQVVALPSPVTPAPEGKKGAMATWRGAVPGLGASALPDLTKRRWPEKEWPKVARLVKSGTSMATPVENPTHGASTVGFEILRRRLENEHNCSAECTAPLLDISPVDWDRVILGDEDRDFLDELVVDFAKHATRPDSVSLILNVMMAPGAEMLRASLASTIVDYVGHDNYNFHRIPAHVLYQYFALGAHLLTPDHAPPHPTGRMWEQWDVLLGAPTLAPENRERWILAGYRHALAGGGCSSDPEDNDYYDDDQDYDGERIVLDALLEHVASFTSPEAFLRNLLEATPASKLRQLSTTLAERLPTPELKATWGRLFAPMREQFPREEFLGWLARGAEGLAGACMMEKGVDWEAVEADLLGSGVNPLVLAASSRKGGSSKKGKDQDPAGPLSDAFVALLLKRFPASKDAPDAAGALPLLAAQASRNSPMLSALLKAGASVAAPGPSGETFVDLLCKGAPNLRQPMLWLVQARPVVFPARQLLAICDNDPSQLLEHVVTNLEAQKIAPPAALKFLRASDLPFEKADVEALTVLQEKRDSYVSRVLQGYMLAQEWNISPLVIAKMTPEEDPKSKKGKRP